MMSVNCTSNTELMSNIGCGRFRIDVNGFAAPNRVGRDIFDLYLINNGQIIARGDDRTTNRSYQCPNNGGGYSCAFHVLTKGMDY